MIKWLFIFILALKTCCDIVLNLINLKHSLRKDLSIPEMLEDVITEESYDKSKKYLKDHTHIGILQEILHACLNIALILLLAPLLESWTITIAGNYYLQGLLFFGVLYLIDYLLSLPFKLIDTFIVEHKHGFNRTSPGTFFMDEIKGLLVGGIFGTFLILGALWLLSYPIWWWRIFLLVLLFFLLVQLIVPRWIMPFFYKLSPLPDGELRKSIEAYANSYAIPMKQIVVMNSSTRSSKGNAAFAGIGSSQRLILFDTLLDYPHEEILSIVAHEWGHRKHLHIWKQLFANLGACLVIFFLANLFTLSSIAQDYFFISSNYGKFYLALSFFAPFLFFVEPILSWLSRKHEFEADRFSLATLNKPKASISSIKRLIKNNLSNLHPHTLYSNWFYSHPSPVERIKAMMRQVN